MNRIHLAALLLMLTFLCQSVPAANPLNYNLEAVSFTTLEGRPYGVFGTGDRMFVVGRGNETNYVASFSIDDREKPLLLDQVPYREEFTSALSRDGVLYVGSSWALNVYDGRGSGLKQSARIEGHVFGLAKEDKVLYQAGIRNESDFSMRAVNVFDISNPLLPQEVNEIPLSSPFDSRISSSGKLLSADGCVFDISNRQNPRFMASHRKFNAIFGGPWFIQPQLGNSWQFMQIYSATEFNGNPFAHIMMAESIDSYSAILYANESLIIGTRGGVRILDPEFRASLESVIGYYDTPGIVMGVATSGDYLYVAEDNGLLVLKFTGQWPKTANRGKIVEYRGPRELRTGQFASGAIRVRNQSQAIWSKDGGYRLLIVEDPAGIVQAPSKRVDLPVNVKIQPNASGEFPLSLKGAAPGSYRIKVQMIRENLTTFGNAFEFTIECHD